MIIIDKEDENMAIKTYKKSDSVKLSENFRLGEFKCKCSRCGRVLVDTELVEILQALEEGKHYHQEFVIYRCVRSTGQPVYHRLEEMVGLYVEVA